MKPGKILTALAASAIAVVMSFALASPAYAADEAMNTDDGDPGGRVEFTAHGDVVKLCDMEADGYSVSLGIWDEDADHKFKYGLDVGGEGTCVKVYADLASKYNLKEDHVFEFYITLVKNGKEGYYTDLAYWSNSR
ncbi:MAG: hypothetical protein ACRDXX_16560 [Stackebrandtia sp.]